MYGHDFPNGYAIVPYEKGCVKSTHDETILNVSCIPMFWNALDLEVMVLTPLEFARGELLCADLGFSEYACTHRLGHVVWHNKVIEHVQTAQLTQGIFIGLQHLDGDIAPALFTGDFITGLEVVIALLL